VHFSLQKDERVRVPVLFDLIFFFGVSVDAVGSRAAVMGHPPSHSS